MLQLYDFAMSAPARMGRLATLIRSEISSELVVNFPGAAGCQLYP
jgi:hypothetical protein